MNKKKSFNARAILWSLIVMILYMFNFYHQVRSGGIECDSWYHLQYTQILLNEGHLPVQQQSYPLFFYFIAAGTLVLRKMSYAAFLFILLWSFLTNLIQIKFIKHFLNDFSDTYALLAGSALSFIWPISTTVIKAFISDNMEDNMFYGLLQVYLRSGATAPYHNLTYLCSKPFALLSVFFFIRIFEEKDKEKIIKNIVWFGCSLLLSVLGKPNFYQCFAPAGVIMTIAYFFKTHRKELKRCVMVAIAYLPATIWMIYSMTMKVQPIAFSPFEGINIFDDGTNVFVVIVRAVAYALFVIACAVYYKQKDTLTVLAFITYAFGLLEWLMLIFPLEKGALDMIWGYDVSMYLLFAATIILSAKIYKEFHNKIVYLIGNAMLFTHALVGVLMFIITWSSRWGEYIKIIAESM